MKNLCRTIVFATAIFSTYTYGQAQLELQGRDAKLSNLFLESRCNTQDMGSYNLLRSKLLWLQERGIGVVRVTGLDDSVDPCFDLIKQFESIDADEINLTGIAAFKFNELELNFNQAFLYKPYIRVSRNNAILTADLPTNINDDDIQLYELYRFLKSNIYYGGRAYFWETSKLADQKSRPTKMVALEIGFGDDAKFRHGWFSIAVQDGEKLVTKKFHIDTLSTDYKNSIFTGSGVATEVTSKPNPQKVNIKLFSSSGYNGIVQIVRTSIDVFNKDHIQLGRVVQELVTD